MDKLKVDPGNTRFHFTKNSKNELNIYFANIIYIGINFINIYIPESIPLF